MMTATMKSRLFMTRETIFIDLLYYSLFLFQSMFQYKINRSNLEVQKFQMLYLFLSICISPSNRDVYKLTISSTLFSNFLLENCVYNHFIILQFMRTQNFPHLPLNNHKISLQNVKNKKDLSIDEDLINKAINRSYLKKMVGSDTLKAEEVINTVANFALSFIPQIDVQKQLQEFWCIVTLNQAALRTEQESCSCVSDSNVVTFDINDLKLYQLFIGLGSKQLRFQSLQSPKGYFVVNFDTVQIQLVYSDTSDKSIQNHIRLVVEKKYNIDFFFTRSTLPIGLRQNISDQDSKKICSDYAKHTDSIIRNAIIESKGKQYNLRSLQLPDSDFYKHLYATEQQFTRYTQTGDIILFKDNHTMAKVQRFLTNSQCDHIGIVFKDQKYGLCIFESNSGTGVSLALWNQLIRYKWFENIQGIFWRRLNMQNRPEDFQDRIREFVKVNLHKEYGLSLGKLLSFNQTVYNNPVEQKNRTYFCSQLVAALYKHLGLLQPGKPSSTYLPKDFTDKGSLNMINNTALEAERRIIFNMKILKQSYKFYK